MTLLILEHSRRPGVPIPGLAQASLLVYQPKVVTVSAPRIKSKCLQPVSIRAGWSCHKECTRGPSSEEMGPVWVERGRTRGWTLEEHRLAMPLCQILARDTKVKIY